MPDASYLDQLDEDAQLLAPLGPPPDQVEDPALLAALVPPPTAPQPHQLPHGDAVPNYTPAGYGTGADKDALAAAEAARNQADTTAKFQDAATSFNHAFGGTAGDLAAPTRAHRDDSFQDVMRRRAMDDQDQTRAKAQHEAQLAAALQRGDSPESVKVKEAFGGTTVGAALRQKMGEEAWTQLPGHAIPGAKEQLMSETDLMKAGLKAKAAGAGGEVDRKAALDALVLAAGGDETPNGQRYRQVFQNAPIKVIQEKGFGQLQQDRGQSFQGGENNKSRAAQIEAARIAAGQKLGEKREGATEDLSKALGPAGGFFPNVKVVEDVLARRGTKDAPGVGLLDQFKADFYHGILNNDPDSRKLVKAADQIQLAYRNLVTGSAASNEEDKRIARAGLDRANEGTFLSGLEVMKRRYQDLLERTYAGVDPRVAQIFISRAPDYGIPGHPTYDPALAKHAAAKYQAASPLNALQPQLVTLENQFKGAAPAGEPPALPTSPVKEPPRTGPAPTAPPGARVKVIGPDGQRGTMDASELAQHPDWRKAE